MKVSQVCALIRETYPGAWFVPVYFNHGDHRVQEVSSITLGKAFLVSRLQILLETARLHLHRLAGAETLKQDLLRFQIPIQANANELYGAFRVGNQDDRVTALGLAAHGDPGHWSIF